MSRPRPALPRYDQAMASASASEIGESNSTSPAVRARRPAACATLQTLAMTLTPRPNGAVGRVAAMPSVSACSSSVMIHVLGRERQGCTSCPASKSSGVRTTLPFVIFGGTALRLSLAFMDFPKAHRPRSLRQIRSNASTKKSKGAPTSSARPK